MSMNRNDALHQVACGIRKYAGMTAKEFIDADPIHAQVLLDADRQFFLRNADKPARCVAAACQSRSRFVEPVVELF